MRSEFSAFVQCWTKYWQITTAARHVWLSLEARKFKD
jgi:hypothetical protein